MSLYSLSTPVLSRLCMFAVTGGSVTLFVNVSHPHKAARITLQVNKIAIKTKNK